MTWRWISASKIGTSHLKTGLRKQDCLSTFLAGNDNTIFCGIVCDGAGSAKYGGQGAAIICRLLSKLIRAYFHTNLSFPTDKTIWDWVDITRDQLALLSQTKCVERKAFASTMLIILADTNQQLTIHVGDGAIVGRDTYGTWKILSAPENGEYASTTYFLTDDPSPRVRISHTALTLSGFSMFSDGIEPIALDAINIRPYDPFFSKMISPIDRLNAIGRNIELSHTLGDFLLSSRVCEKTDDDKTLVLVSSL